MKSLLLTLCCFSGVAAHSAATLETQINFSSPLRVYLHNNQASEAQSEFDLVIECGNTKWKGNASLSCEVEIPEEDDYEVYLIASVDWLVESWYALMFHWTSITPQPDGSQKTFESSVSNNILK